MTDETIISSPFTTPPPQGMSRRDWFAAFALSGILGCSLVEATDPELIARGARRYADALLEELERKGG